MSNAVNYNPELKSIDDNLVGFDLFVTAPTQFFLQTDHGQTVFMLKGTTMKWLLKNPYSKVIIKLHGVQC